MTDVLAELGMHRIACPVPFPQAGGPANVWVIEDEGGGVALFDSGLGTVDGEAAVREGFAALGLAFGDVRRIFLSHGHIDHYGLARTISEASGAPVFVHAADRAKVETPGPEAKAAREAMQAYLAHLGVERADIDGVFRLYDLQLSMARPLERTEPLAHGDRIEFAKFAVEVEHAPGHTPGLVCLLDRAHGVLFSDDHLLERISPNPLLEVGPDGAANKFRALSSYLATLDRTRTWPAHHVLPGHGAPFTDPVRTIDSLLGFYGKRQARIRERLASGGASSSSR